MMHCAAALGKRRWRQPPAPLDCRRANCLLAGVPDPRHVLRAHRRTAATPRPLSHSAPPSPPRSHYPRPRSTGMA
jgi:hypothetical protein